MSNWQHPSDDCMEPRYMKSFRFNYIPVEHRDGG